MVKRTNFRIFRGKFNILITVYFQRLECFFHSSATNFTLLSVELLVDLALNYYIATHAYRGKIVSSRLNIRVAARTVKFT